MPIVSGYHIPEIVNPRARPSVFNVLLLDLSFNQVSTVSIYVDMLHNYLDTLGLSRNRIRLHVATDNETSIHGLTIMNDELKAHVIDIESKDEILELASLIDADIILDEKDRFTKNEIFKKSDSLVIVQYFNPQFNDLLNAICTGWDVPWNFREPIWNASWISKYLERGTLAKRVFDFMDTSRMKNYTDEQRHIVRNLSNKISQVNHCKQLLDYNLILRRYAKRHNVKAEDILFEISYELNNYYILISGCLDVMARLINDVYELGFEPYQSYTLDKKEFLKRLTKKRKSLASDISLNKYLDWMDWMKKRRNMLAHESYLYLTPLVKRKDVQLSEAEIEQAVNAAFPYDDYVRAGIDSSYIDGLKEMQRFQIDLEQNHETVIEDTMTMTKQDRKTGVEKEVLFLPLRAIEDDYKNMCELINRIMKNLEGSRPRPKVIS
jgi:hypothetical protein